MPAKQPMTSDQFLKVFAMIGVPTSHKATELLRSCPDEELGALLTALYKTGVPIFPDRKRDALAET